MGKRKRRVLNPHCVTAPSLVCCSAEQFVSYGMNEYSRYFSCYTFVIHFMIRNVLRSVCVV